MRSLREGKRVRTESTYIDPADGGSQRRRLQRKIAEFIKANMTPRHLVIDEEQMLRAYNELAAREQQAREKLLGELHDKYGLRVADTPRPVAPPTELAIPTTPAAEAEAKESPSDAEGQDTRGGAVTA